MITRLWRGLALALATSMIAPAARAERDDFVITAAVYIAFEWDHFRVGMGLDVKVTRLLWGDTSACSKSGKIGGAGVLARATFVIPDAALVMIGAHVGRHLVALPGENHAWSLEAGGAWRSRVADIPGGRGPFFGGTYDFDEVGELRASVPLLIDDDGLRPTFETALGVRVPGPFVSTSEVCAVF